MNSLKIIGAMKQLDTASVNEWQQAYVSCTTDGSGGGDAASAGSAPGAGAGRAGGGDKPMSKSKSRQGKDRKPQKQNA